MRLALMARLKSSLRIREPPRDWVQQKFSGIFQPVSATFQEFFSLTHRLFTRLRVFLRLNQIKFTVASSRDVRLQAETLIAAAFAASRLIELVSAAVSAAASVPAVARPRLSFGAVTAATC